MQQGLDGEAGFKKKGWQIAVEYVAEEDSEELYR